MISIQRIASCLTTCAFCCPPTRKRHRQLPPFSLPFRHVNRIPQDRNFLNQSKSQWFPLSLLILMVCTMLVCTMGQQLFGQTKPMTAPAAQSVAPRDGQHDFDFNIGVWHTRIRFVLDPFSSSSESIVLEGTVTIRKVWGGEAQLEEIEADGPKGHWEGLGLFLYAPNAHQWSQSFINSQLGELGPPLIGEFHDGRGELFGPDTFKGKAILVRAVWSGIEANAHRYEESYSDDGGRTWKISLHAELTRDDRVKEQDGSAIADPAGKDAITAGQHEFDFDLGAWKTRSTRLLHPLTGSHEWVEMNGTTVVKKVWGGRANLAEFDAGGAGGIVMLLALRWFNPKTSEWNLNFATPQVGTPGVPGVGKFKNGRADFYDYEMIGGRSVLVRFSIWKITDDTAQSEQAFSEDGGKTWEINWINQYTRIKGE
jgi:hypothetical protein